MLEHELETRRLPRPHRPTLLVDPRLRLEAVARYASLEFPRESVGWLLGASETSAPGTAPARRPTVRQRIRDWVLAPQGS
ncbi:MAG TPA: hypothetical protein VEE86_00460 [Thermoplasmata archaeon]|nr:hypothetical protein [Thermoplasmata archaeon]